MPEPLKIRETSIQHIGHLKATIVNDVQVSVIKAVILNLPGPHSNIRIPLSAHDLNALALHH